MFRRESGCKLTTFFPYRANKIPIYFQRTFSFQTRPLLGPRAFKSTAAVSVSGCKYTTAFGLRKGPAPVFLVFFCVSKRPAGKRLVTQGLQQEKKQVFFKDAPVPCPIMGLHPFLGQGFYRTIPIFRGGDFSPAALKSPFSLPLPQ